MAKEELAVEVTEVDCIEIDDVNLSEAGENEVFEQLASDAACSNEQDARLEERKKRGQNWIAALNLMSRGVSTTVRVSIPV